MTNKNKIQWFYYTLGKVLRAREDKSNEDETRAVDDFFKQLDITPEVERDCTETGIISPKTAPDSTKCEHKVIDRDESRYGTCRACRLELEFAPKHWDTEIALPQDLSDLVELKEVDNDDDYVVQVAILTNTMNQHTKLLNTLTKHLKKSR